MARNGLVHLPEAFLAEMSDDDLASIDAQADDEAGDCVVPGHTGKCLCASLCRSSAQSAIAAICSICGTTGRRVAWQWLGLWSLNNTDASCQLSLEKLHRLSRACETHPKAVRDLFACICVWQLECLA